MVYLYVYYLEVFFFGEYVAHLDGLHLLPITSIAQSFARIHEWYETFPFDAQKSPSRKATMSVEFAVVISVSTDARV